MRHVLLGVVNKFVNIIYGVQLRLKHKRYDQFKGFTRPCIRAV